jgi:hypothetical protein
MAYNSAVTKLDDPLSPLEREFVRQIMGIDGKPGSAVREDSETRMVGLAPEQCQIVRALIYEDYEEIGLNQLRIEGGQKGVRLSLPENRKAVAAELRRMLYPTSANDPDDPGFDGGIPTAGQLGFVQLTSASGSTEYD